MPARSAAGCAKSLSRAWRPLEPAVVGTPAVVRSGSVAPAGGENGYEMVATTELTLLARSVGSGA